jgi:hypothetical protein
MSELSTEIPVDCASDDGGSEETGGQHLVSSVDTENHGQQFPSQTFAPCHRKYEYCVKVFNSSVENFVEKGLRTSKLSTRTKAYSSLHQYCAAARAREMFFVKNFRCVPAVPFLETENPENGKVCRKMGRASTSAAAYRG